ncbi:hypothetical protein MP638_002623 [Amoeboaphelidium occidentale]|nr:hypothetical protein MP638_002623 [Amoeboaphelidium occidentale]
MSSIKITVKSSSGSTSKVDLSVQPEEQTVLQLKEKISAELNVPSNEQRLIYSGKIMKDEDKLSVYKIMEGHTIHLVRSKPATAAASTPAPATTATTTTAAPRSLNMDPSMNPLAGMPFMNPFMGGAGGMGMPPAAATGQQGNMDMPPNPMLQQMMQGLLQNPRVLAQQMLAFNPQMRQMGMDEEQLTQMISSPMFQQMLSDPRMMQMAMAQGGGAGGAGAGLGGLGGMSGLQGNPFLSMMGSPGMQQQQQQQSPIAGGGIPRVDPSMNPFMSQLTNQMFSNAGVAGAGGLGGAAAAGRGGMGSPQSNVPPEVRFETQLRQLREMGFFDPTENLRALTMTNGNVNAAVEFLLANGATMGGM